MKRKQSRQQIDTLYILGAGSSYALSYVKPTKDKSGNEKTNRNVTPLDKDFLRRLHNVYHKSGWTSNSIMLLASNWLDDGSVFNECLETAIIKRVSQFDFLSHLNKKRTHAKISNEDYLNHIVHLISAYLLGCKSNSTGNTKTFVNHIFPPGLNAEDYKNRIITFNYDTLIERPLFERSSSDGKISINKIYFDRLTKTKEMGVRRKPNQKFIHPLILKLHGSANWRCDRNIYDDHLFRKPESSKKFPIWLGNKRLNPDDSESSLIIPPIPNKPVTAIGLFKVLWTTAFEYLHEAKNVVIVGYSCPYTDTLARVMFSHFKNKKLETITIVDPNAETLKNFREIINQKYISGNTVWKYFGSLQEYINIEIKSNKNLI